MPTTQPGAERALRHPIKHRPDIDGLRAVAVLFVVIFHAYPKRMPGGFVGVDVFFVISGFLISSIIFSSLEADSFSITSFYNRRIRRIFPALLSIMVASLAFGWLALLGDEYSQLGTHIAGGAAFVSNFVLYHEVGYFDTSSALKPMLHLWSLAIEEQFYIFWPLLLAFVWKRKWSFLRITIVVAVLSFASNLYLVQHFPSAAYYWPIARFWELMIGGILAYLSLHRPQVLRRGTQLQSTFAFVFLGLGAFLIDNENSFPGWWALLPTVGAFLAISAGPQGWFNRHVLSNRVFVWIGLISYPLYLWHWPLLSFSRILLGDIPHGVREAAIGVSILLAWLTYRFVETPIRRDGGRRTAIALASVMIVVCLAGFSIHVHRGFAERALIQKSSFNRAVAQQFTGNLWAYTENDQCLRRFPYPGTRSYMWWFCFLEKDAPPTAIILGNSYANQLYPGLAHQPLLARQNFLSIGTCDAATDFRPIVPTPPKDSPLYGNRCQEQAKFIDGIIASNPSIRYAILGGLRGDPDAYYIARLKSRIDFLESHGITVIVFYPHLRVDVDVRRCFSRPFLPARRNCTLPISDRSNLNAEFEPLVESIQKSNPKALFFDENDVFCGSGQCSLIRDGLPLYRDTDQHISEFASDWIGNRFVTFLDVHQPAALK